MRKLKIYENSILKFWIEASIIFLYESDSYFIIISIFS